MAAGSLLAAVSSSLVPFIIGRGLQGMGLPIIPLAISVLRSALPTDRVGPAMGLMSSSLGVGGALGLPLSAVIAQKADWHSLFWFAGVLGILAVLLFHFLVPDVPPQFGRQIRPARYPAARGGVGDAASADLQGVDVGLDELDDAGDVRRLRRGVRRLRPVAVPHHRADRRSADHAAAAGADDQRGVGSGVFRDVRALVGRAAGARTALGDRLRTGAVDAADRAVAGSGRPGDDGCRPARGPCRRPPRPEVHVGLRFGDHRGRLPGCGVADRQSRGGDGGQHRHQPRRRIRLLVVAFAHQRQRAGVGDGRRQRDQRPGAVTGHVDVQRGDRCGARDDDDQLWRAHDAVTARSAHRAGDCRRCRSTCRRCRDDYSRRPRLRCRLVSGRLAGRGGRTDRRAPVRG